MTTRDEAERALPHYLHMQRGINLWQLDSTIDAALSAGVAEERAQHAVDCRERCLQLFIAASGLSTTSAEFQRAMDAGQTLFEVAQQLHDLMQLQPDVQTGRTARGQRESAGFASGDKRTQDRLSEWDKWQQAASDMRAANPRISNTQICSKVGARFGVTGRAVAKRVQLNP